MHEKKLHSLNPIFIQDLSDIKDIDQQYTYNQKIKFFCQNCKEEVITQLGSFKARPKLLCKFCKARESKKNTDWNAFREKCRKTCLERYGAASFTQTKAYREKTKATNLKKYGVEWQTQSKDVQKKIEENSLLKYGTRRPSQADCVKEKTKQHNLEVWGYVSTALNPQVREKQQKTWLEKYGVDNPLKSKDIHKKCQETYKQTCLDRYGVDNYLKTKECRNKIKATNLEKYGSEEWFGSELAKGIAKQTWLEKYGVTNPAQAVDNRRKAARVYKYQDTLFDSSWELALWIYAKDNHESIIKEPCSFEYKFENKTHYYFPDFLYKDVLIEIKGSQFLENNKMINPFDRSQDDLMEAKHQCALQNNVKFWGYQEIKPYIKYITNKYGKSYLQSFRIKRPENTKEQKLC